MSDDKNTFGGIAQAIATQSELVKSVYTDGASGAVRETGLLLTDLVKAARLVAAPIQYAAHLQDRLDRHMMWSTDFGHLKAN